MLPEVWACADGQQIDRLEKIGALGFVVRSGRVAVGRRSIDGRESLVALMEEGDLFGEMSLFDEGTRSASARALDATGAFLAARLRPAAA